MNSIPRIFIIGHSGAGKGVLADALAKKLGWQFLDADFAIAPTIGRSLVEIIGRQGEEGFDKCLNDILAHQCAQQNIVVTTDDSIVSSAKNRQLLANEFVVYLQVSLEVQMQRIAHNRPLLPTPDYQQFLRQLREQRDNWYAQVASISISSDNGEIDEHVHSVINAMIK